MSGPQLRTSSGLVSSALADVRARVTYWMERSRASGQHDLAEAVVSSLAGVAAVACSSVIADVYRAGVASGRLAAYLELGSATPPAAPPPACRCPRCAADITLLPGDARPIVPDGPGDGEDTRRITKPFEPPK